jgi:hypothetical protein
MTTFIKISSLFFIFSIFNSTDLFAQKIVSFKTKNAQNQIERTQILDLIRADLYQYHQQEFIFVVNKLNINIPNIDDDTAATNTQFAWFMGDAQRKDGKKIKLDPYSDCCHVEALLKKSKGKWYIVELHAFSTDVWYENLWERTGAPQKLFF